MRRLVAPALLATWLAIGPTAVARAQLGAGNTFPDATELVEVVQAPVSIAAGGRARARITLRIDEGWHINANRPTLDYMIPTEVSFQRAAGLAAGKPAYPEPHRQKLAFEETPLLVYDGETIVDVPLIAAASTPAGVRVLRGTVSFQACNDQVCLVPSEVAFDLSVTVTDAAPGTTPGAADSMPAGALGAETPPSDDAGAAGQSPAFGPAAGGLESAAPSVLNNPIARLFERGSFVAFLSLFLIGLALNLTPCVYPMMGVTVSIFGARRAVPPLQAFGLASIYVLGIAVMYSALGLVAAFTGGLFGGFLQSPLVLVGIGSLLVVLALSMFGLYELQLPVGLLSGLGGAGTTSAAGIFLSGLVVGVFAAPCIGPPVVALLALVGAKGDPWFGFTSFFVLSMGLGAPYLVLGTFSNLLQRLPRSGDWMVWVKQVFGVILASVGLFYVLLAAAPKWSGWVLPAALIAGGAYLGFLERSGQAGPVRRGFRRLKWLTGTAALVAGVFLVVAATRPGIAFSDFDPVALRGGLERGQPALLDFTADWCAPCHELDRYTFTDRRVIEQAKAFQTFKVDLTRYNSPPVERLRRQYGITGVPTVVFLARDGREVKEARVEGFLPPEPFLARMRRAAEASAVAARTP